MYRIEEEEREWYSLSKFYQADYFKGSIILLFVFVLKHFIGGYKQV